MKKKKIIIIITITRTQLMCMGYFHKNDAYLFVESDIRIIMKITHMLWKVTYELKGLRIFRRSLYAFRNSFHAFCTKWPVKRSHSVKSDLRIKALRIFRHSLYACRNSFCAFCTKWPVKRSHSTGLSPACTGFVDPHFTGSTRHSWKVTYELRAYSSFVYLHLTARASF